MEQRTQPLRTPLSVIIPAYNEEDAIGPQVDAIRRVLLSHAVTYEILVIDDGSEDQTAARAIRTGARVLRHPANRGYGAALKSGILAAEYETIVIIDADGTYPAGEIPALVAKLDTADMVVGARVGKHVHIPLVRRPGKRFLGWLATRISGQPIPDLNSGMRAFRRECAKQYLSILPNGFSFTTTITLALLGDDYRVVYHPIDYYRRVGQSKITPRNFMDFTILVLRMAMLFQPLKIFVPLALACICLGLMKTVLDIVAVFSRPSSFGWSLLHQPVLSTSAILLLLVGLQLMLIGMVGDGLLRRIARYNRPGVPSHGMWVSESGVQPGVKEEEMALIVKE